MTGAGSKGPMPGPLPPPVATQSEISESAMRAGEEERKRIRRRRGKASTILTSPGLGVPNIQTQELRTTLG